MDWFQVAQYRDQWRAFVKKVSNLWVQEKKKWEVYWQSERQLASEEILFSLEFGSFSANIYASS
jgi:hypothetical protein